MKVKCINIYNVHTKKFEESSYWLTIGKEYVVLEIDVYQNKKINYRLIGDNETESPALYNPSQFIITSNKIPSNWKIYQFENGKLSFSPGAWQNIEFWDSCYDGDPIALEIYKRETRIILEEARNE